MLGILVDLKTTGKEKVFLKKKKPVPLMNQLSVNFHRMTLHPWVSFPFNWSLDLGIFKNKQLKTLLIIVCSFKFLL